MEQFILFGDSLIEQSFSAGIGVFGPALTTAYIRRLDVVNRGFSGYNTSQALQILPNFMPSPSQAKVRLMLIFFGANDARLPNTPGGPDQHVPLEQYKKNLAAIATHPCIQAHEHIRLILVTPFPVDERQLMSDDESFHGVAMLRRTASVTAAYADGARQIGHELGLPVLDLWTAIMQRCTQQSFRTAAERQSLPGMVDSPANETLRSFLSDGLHFTRLGYQVFFEETMDFIKQTWPDQKPDQLPYVFPRWGDEKAWARADTLPSV